MTSGISQLPVRVRPTPRRRGGWRLCLLAAAPRALATVAIKQPGTPVRLSVSSEDSPQVIASSGDLLVAWKPPKLSMRRRRGGEASDLEAWAAAAAGAATAVTTLGRGIGGLVLLSRRRESAKEAAAAIKGGQAKASLHAVVQGEPVLQDAAVFDEGQPLGGPESRLEVTRACEGLKLGRLSLLKVTLQYEEGIEKQVRRALAQLEHRVIGNGQLCARAAGLRRTFLAVTGFRCRAREAPQRLHPGSENGDTSRARRISETSLLSLESAPDKASPAGLTSPSSMQASGTEILEAFASPRSFSKDPQHDHEGTETFVTSQIQQQQRKAVEVAKSHSERRMSVLTTYNSDRSNGKTWSRRAERVTSSIVFTYGIMSVILANMILLGVEVDFTARLPQNEVPPWFVLANAVVVLIFVVELFILFTATGVKNFFCGPDRSWNIFDFSIIAWSVLETSIELWALTVATPEAQVSASHLRFVRTMRLVRAFRGVRVVRLLRYVSALRTLVLSIISSMASLCWTLALLVLLFYSFGIVFTQLVMDYCRDEAVRSTGDVNAQPVCPNNVAFYWASVPESMLTLFTAITGGMNWEDAMVPLRLISPLAASCFVFYIAIAVLAVVNVVTGVFCSTAMESASADKEIATMKQLQRKNAQVADLRRVFQEIVDEENLVNLQEFQNAMNLPRFANFLESMGISTEDIAILFTVIDADRSGFIDLDEFVQGCLQLHGPAKSLQLAKMSFENKITRQAIKAIGSALVEMRLEMRQDITSLQESVERFSV